MVSLDEDCSQAISRQTMGPLLLLCLSVTLPVKQATNVFLGIHLLLDSHQISSAFALLPLQNILAYSVSVHSQNLRHLY